MKSITVYKEVEIDVELDDFSDDDLRDELDRRGQGLDQGSGNSAEILTTIWQKRRNGQDYQRELDELIYDVLGKIV